MIRVFELEVIRDNMMVNLNDIDNLSPEFIALSRRSTLSVDTRPKLHVETNLL